MPEPMTIAALLSAGSKLAGPLMSALGIGPEEPVPAVQPQQVNFQQPNLVQLAQSMVPQEAVPQQQQVQQAPIEAPDQIQAVANPAWRDQFNEPDRPIPGMRSGSAFEGPKLKDADLPKSFLKYKLNLKPVQANKIMPAQDSAGDSTVPRSIGNQVISQQRNQVSAAPQRAAAPAQPTTQPAPTGPITQQQFLQQNPEFQTLQNITSTDKAASNIAGGGFDPAFQGIDQIAKSGSAATSLLGGASGGDLLGLLASASGPIASLLGGGQEAGPPPVQRQQIQFGQGPDLTALLQAMQSGGF